MRGRAYISCALLGLAICVSGVAGSDLSGSQRGDQYERAAFNYETASAARVETAEALLALSRELRKKAHEDERKRIAELTKAGSYERQAGQLFSAACSGYDKAAAAWASAATEYRAKKDEPKAEMMTASAEAARDAGTAACKRAAEAYEYSAEAFSDVDSGQMAASAEAAARMREVLAKRIR